MNGFYSRINQGEKSCVKAYGILALRFEPAHMRKHLTPDQWLMAIRSDLELYFDGPECQGVAF